MHSIHDTEGANTLRIEASLDHANRTGRTIVPDTAQEVTRIESDPATELRHAEWVRTKGWLVVDPAIQATTELS